MAIFASGVGLFDPTFHHDLKKRKSQLIDLCTAANKGLGVSTNKLI